MSDLQNGSLVRHVSLGVGKIVALEPSAVHVFFPDSDKRFAAKLRLPAARALLRVDGFEPNDWLAGLTAFAIDATTGRYALSSTWLTHEQALAQFKAAFPGGFADPAYLEPGKARPGREARWRAGQAACAKRLARADVDRLVEEGDVAGLVARICDVDKAVAALHPPADVGAVKEALADEETARPLVLSLMELLSVPSPGRARFDKLFAAARALPVDPAQQWLVATLLPFLAAPDKHVLLRPRTTCLGAERLGCDVRYEPSPCWATYAALRAVQVSLLERLAPLGARDFVDVEGFLHVIAAARKPTARAVAAAAERRARRAT